MHRFALSLGIIVAGLFTGYVAQRVARRGGADTDALPDYVSRVRRNLQRVVLLGVNPLASALALWVFPFDDIRVVYMPFLGALALVAGGASALLGGRALKLEPRRAGAFFCAGSMFNIGSIGALLVYMALGEVGFAFVPMYRVAEELLYYGLGFPIARSFSHRTDPQARRRRLLADPFVIMALLGLAVGFGLNLSGVARPTLLNAVNPVIVPLGSFLLLVSIGLAMRFGRVTAYLREALGVAAIKYLVVPVAVTGAAWTVGLGSVDNGMALRVVAILSSVPVGFIALVPPTLYDLDVDLANAAWLVTTILLVVVVPLQYLFVSLV